MKLNRLLFIGICLSVINICIVLDQPLIHNKGPLQESDTTLGEITLMVKTVSS
jgi:hypothetical protein